MGSHRDVDLVVVGLGYVGLPLAQGAALAGLRVSGLDQSTRVVDGLNEGRSPIDDIADAELREMLAARHLQPGTLVAPESTTHPGTTDDVVRPVLLTILLQPHRDIDVAELADRAAMLFDTRGKTAGHPRTVLL